LIAQGSTSLNGGFTQAAGGTLQILGSGAGSSANVTIGNGFTNNGAIELTTTGAAYGANLTVNGTLLNPAGKTTNTLVGAGAPRTLTAQLDNQGTLTINQPLTLNRASTAYTNSGLINLVSGDLTLTQSGTTPSFTNTGTVTIPVGRTMTVNNGSLTQQTLPAAINGGGALVLNGVTSRFATDFTLASLTVSSGTASFSTNLSTGVQALNFTNATINGPGSITNPTSQTLTLLNTTINNV